MRSKTRQALLHLSAGIALLLPLIGSLASLSTFNERLARGVVDSLWLVAALQGNAEAVAEWNQAHAVRWWEGPAQTVAELGLLGLLVATLLEVVAWRQRRAVVA